MLKSINRIKIAAQFIIGAVDLYENELKKGIGTEDHRRNVLLYRIMQDMQEINNIISEISIEKLGKDVHNFNPSDEDIEKMIKNMNEKKYERK